MSGYGPRVNRYGKVENGTPESHPDWLGWDYVIPQPRRKPVEPPPSVKNDSLDPLLGEVKPKAAAQSGPFPGVPTGPQFAYQPVNDNPFPVGSGPWIEIERARQAERRARTDTNPSISDPPTEEGGRDGNTPIANLAEPVRDAVRAANQTAPSNPLTGSKAGPVHLSKSRSVPQDKRVERHGFGGFAGGFWATCLLVAVVAFGFKGSAAISRMIHPPQPQVTQKVPALPKPAHSVPHHRRAKNAEKAAVPQTPAA